MPRGPRSQHSVPAVFKWQRSSRQTWRSKRSTQELGARATSPGAQHSRGLSLSAQTAKSYTLNTGARTPHPASSVHPLVSGLGSPVHGPWGDHTTGHAREKHHRDLYGASYKTPTTTLDVCGALQLITTQPHALKIASQIAFGYSYT